MSKNIYKKEGLFYRGEERQWEEDLYGFFPRGMGDLQSNTLNKIWETRDRSKWAYQSLEACINLLLENKRWPDEWNDEHIAKNWFHQKWSELLKKVFPKRIEKYRPQTSMTRDPWIYMYATAVMLNMKSPIHFRMPWHLYRPKIWAWRTYLLVWSGLMTKLERNNYEDRDSKKRNKLSNCL